MSSSTLTSSALVVLPLIALFWRLLVRNTRLPLPPGPKRWPLIGNLLDMPAGGLAWLSYAKLCAELDSDIISLEVFGTVIVVLNTTARVNDLLEKRSSIYSSRPHSTMIHDLIGWKFSFSLGAYDDIWRAQRKIFTQVVNPSQPTRFHAQQIAATHELLQRLLDVNPNVMDELHYWAAITIMDITYGIRGAEAEPYIAVAVKSLDAVAEAAAPGAFMVEVFPLRYIPGWFPGAGFQAKAREWSDLRVAMTEKPFTAAKCKIASGLYTESLTSVALSQIDKDQDIVYQEQIIKAAAVTCYGGGSDTVVSAITALILAMLLHPEIQRTAQQQIDSVLGHGILPTFDDQHSLPFITAIVREVLRHNPVTPLAIPHLLMEDDVYAGYHIPKDAIVIGNVWSILHDPQTYENPAEFNPRRFLDANGQLDPNVKDPATASFGWGRRICPGRHVAIASIWIATASILAMYDITKEVDSQGNIVEPSGEWFSGPTLFNHPLPFKCVFKPRSKATEAAIVATAL